MDRRCPLTHETCKKILDPTSDFQCCLIEYLEATHIGEFLTGTREEVQQRIAKKDGAAYVDLTKVLPTPPPFPCEIKCADCACCKNMSAWESSFASTVDHILASPNIHTCRSTKKKDGSQDKRHQYVGCLDNKWGTCKARFPRPTFPQTIVDKFTGALDMKKLEAMMNNIAPAITYLFRCNTDVTNLRSGTVIKGVLSYCTNYITKPGLKTWAVFEAIRTVIQKGGEIIGSSLPRQEKARQLMTWLVNNIGAKMELGLLMIAMYLLGNPDHYTSHKFTPFYWSQFVSEALSPWKNDTDSEPSMGECLASKVIIIKRKNRIVGLSPVLDYMHCLPALKNMDLYTWVSQCKHEKKKSISGTGKHHVDENILQESDVDESDVEVGIDDVKSSLHDFTSDHPLFSTHATRRVAIDKSLVPNIIGAPLPCQDQSDREYYCTAMLTFFKPWRSGMDLKRSDQSWDDAFTSHVFTPCQHELMDNFNLRYECLDGRDDFHA